MIPLFLKKRQQTIVQSQPKPFYPDQDSPANLILLDAFKERLEFPDLKRVAMGTV